MPGDGPFKECPVCGKDKPTTRTGVMASHRRWTGREMVPCKGTFKHPKK